MIQQYEAVLAQVNKEFQKLLERAKELEHLLGMADIKHTTNERVIRDLKEQLRQEREENAKKERYRASEKKEVE